MKKESNKRNMNPLLKSLIKTGSEKEKQVQSAASIEEIVEEQSEKKETAEINGIIPENNISEIAGIQEENENKEKTISKIPELPEKKDTYEKLITKRSNGEVVYVPIKISTTHNNLLKKISVAEKVSMQDLLANIIDAFEQEYQKEIKISVKKLLS